MAFPLLPLLLFSLNILLGTKATLRAEEGIPERPVEVALQRFGQHHLAFTMRHHPHWHTYWKNPGAAGLPTEIKIQGLEVEPLEWPAPQTHREQGGVITFGYEGEITRFFKVQRVVSEKIEISARWLVCRHICIPGQIKINARWPRGKGVGNLTPPNPFEVSAKDLRTRMEQLPRSVAWPHDLELQLLKGESKNGLSLLYRRPGQNGTLPAGSDLLTPFSHPLLTLKHEQLKYDGQGIHGRLDAEWDGEYKEPPLALPTNGQFPSPLKLKFLYRASNAQALIIERAFSSFQIEGNTQLLKEFEQLPSTAAPFPPASANRHLLFYLLLAFVGGLILNIMPCVLPVISLKLFHLVGHADESPRMILKHNFFYTLGTIGTFVVLGLVTIALKAAGVSVGQGFQMQSPHFVSVMAVFLFLLGLNLFGLFEFRTPGGKVLGDLEIKRGVWGDLASGILATILATPCSAPFLGTALTFALATDQSAAIILLVFSFVGAGLAFPFIATGLFPKSIALLPRPGAWMEQLKRFLGLTLFLSVLWLLDVFTALVDASTSVIQLHTALLLLFFAFYLRKKITTNFYAQGFFFALSLALLLQMHFQELPRYTSSQTMAVGELDWRPWSRQQMQEHKERGRLTFINFTAKWCLTCKVNEKLVFDTRAFKALVKDKNIALLKGDWTKYDPQIGDFLKENGFVGVPAYFLQTPMGQLIPLGEVITHQKILRHIEKLDSP